MGSDRRETGRSLPVGGVGRLRGKSVGGVGFLGNLEKYIFQMNRSEVFDYLAGLICGDGSFWYSVNDRTYHVYVYDKDKTFLETIAKICREFLNVKSIRIRKLHSKNSYELELKGSTIYHELSRRINKLLVDPNIPFIRGLTDAEGSLYYSNTITLEITNTEEYIITAIHKVLEEHNIKHFIVKEKRKSPRKDIIKVRVRGWSNVTRFVQIIQPIHPKIKDKFSLLSKNLKSSLI